MPTYPNTPQDGHEHEMSNAVIVAADWVRPPPAVDQLVDGVPIITAPVDSLPVVWKEGTATFTHSCILCGMTKSWKV